MYIDSGGETRNAVIVQCVFIDSDEYCMITFLQGHT